MSRPAITVYLCPVTRVSDFQPLTIRGAARPECPILQAADELILVHGVNHTALTTSGGHRRPANSQLYHHFPDKEALVAAVIARRAEVILERESALLGRVDSCGV